MRKSRWQPDAFNATTPGNGKYAHVQIAGLPDRHEPDDGEINYPWLFRLFDEVGYQGWIGCEYKPRGLTEEGLGWFDARR